MLTGDENIVDINLTVVWKIKDAKNYLFSMRSPDETVSVAAQSVLREIVGQSEMQPIITGDRGKVEDDTKEELQRVLDEFGAGIQIVRVKLQKADPPREVVDAFNFIRSNKRVHSSNDLCFSWRFLFKRDFLLNKKLTFIDEIRFGEDMVFNLAAIMMAKKIFLIPEPLYIYRVNNPLSIMKMNYRNIQYPSPYL